MNSCLYLLLSDKILSKNKNIDYHEKTKNNLKQVIYS